MRNAPKLAVIGFDSVSLPTILKFVERGTLPTIGRLIERGCVTQTWPCFPMETGTNWACLATGASPLVSGCNMSVHYAGDPLDKFDLGFPASVCKAEQLWTAARRAGKRSVVFDWSQSFPLAFEDGIIHVGEDGRPDNAWRALQEVRAYATHPRQLGPHVCRIEPQPANGWAAAAEGALEFEAPINPGFRSRYREVAPLFGLIPSGPNGCERVELYASKEAAEPLLTFRPGAMTDWTRHTFTADGGPAPAAVRGKLLKLSPDAHDVHLYLSEIYPLHGFVHPAHMADELVETCGPFIIQCSRQQVVQGGASDIATYFEEQEYLARWWRDAAGSILQKCEWDLFMLKWHGPDWTNHLTMYMIDPQHPMYEQERAAEGWALWDRLMGWGDEIVARVIEAAGPDALIALVSDHGGGTQIPGTNVHPAPNAILRANGWLRLSEQGSIDWKTTVAFGRHHYVFLNVKGRDPHGTVETGAEYLGLRDDIMQALIGAADANGRRLFQAVLPVEDAGRLGVGGDRVGDIFLLPCPPHPLHTVPPEELRKTHSERETGTWDWPRLNTGLHLADSYFVLAGPGVRQGFRRPRPALITSVAPTLAAAMGIPAPAQADGAVLRDFLA